ncbi:MAG: hypothetical protein IPG71_09160 [bacterium]|nr:hypothetical protein [bacterium]
MARYLCAIPFTMLLMVGPSFAALSGGFTVGPTGDFETLGEAVDSLMTTGISGRVTFTLAPGVFDGPIQIGDFPGSGSALVAFISTDPSAATITSSDGTNPALLIDGARRLHFENLRIVSTNPLQPAMSVRGTANDVYVFSCDFASNGPVPNVEVTNGSSNVRFKLCRIRGGSDGVSFTSNLISGLNNRLEKCAIDSVQRAVFVSKQSNCRIEWCDLRPNSAAGSGATGVYIGAQNPLDSVLVLGNSISELQTGSGYAVALRHAPQTSASRLVAANNFIFGFQNTGSSQVRALFLSAGDNRIVNNSVLANDVTATGTSYTVYNGLTSAESRLTLLNNILVNQEASRPAYGLFVLTTAGQLTANNNLYFGTGAAYQMGWQLTGFTALAEWQTATGQDVFSTTGDPLFVSDSDLHLQPTAALTHQNGAVAHDVPVDFDGASRFQPPDIGADEYQFAAPEFDAAILDVVGLPLGAPAYSLISLNVVIQNRGSSAISNLPLQLTFDDTLRAEVLANLAPSVTDTVLLVWSIGAAHAETTPTIEARLPGDAHPQDNIYGFTLTITTYPMSGLYTVGGAVSDYPTLSAAVSDLALRGVSSDVRFEVAPGLYSESVEIAAITGASEFSGVTIRPSHSAEGAVVFAPTAAAAALQLSGASYITLEGLQFVGGATTPELIRIDGGGSHNVIRFCSVSGDSRDVTTSSLISIGGGGCSDNLIADCELTGAHTGVRLEGTSQLRDSANAIRSSKISSTRCAVFSSWQRGLLIEQSVIIPGHTLAPAVVYGIRLSSGAPGDTTIISGCRIVGGSGTGAIYGISAETVSSTVLARNNWIGDFDSLSTAAIHAVHCQSGETVLWHNSIEIGNSAGTGAAICLSLSGTQAVARLRNSILRVSRTDGLARTIYWSGGVIDSDYNLYETPGSNLEYRFAASALDEDIQTLSAWTLVSAQDSNSVTSQSGFIAPGDLHIRPDAAGPSNRGVELPGVPYDIDNEPRSSSPDIGADEYEYLSAIVDVKVEVLEIPAAPLQSGLTYQLFSVVQNSGQLAADNVVVQLLFDEVVFASQIVSLAPGDYAEQSWPWTAPVTELMFGSLKLRVSAAGDLVPANDALNCAVVVSGAPLSGVVSVGGGAPQFGTLEEVAAHLKWRGVSDNVIVSLAPGTYTSPLRLDSIPGASSLSRVTFRPEVPGSVILAAPQAAATFEFRGASYVTLTGLSFGCGSGTPNAILFSPGSCFNQVDSCTITGAGLADISSVGIRFGGAGCVGNVVSHSTITSAHVGVELTGDDFNLSRDNVISANQISNVYFGVWVDHQVNALIEGNDIVPGSQSGPANACYGVYALQLGSGGSLRVDGNRIHGFLDAAGPRSNRAAGVYSAAGGNATVEILNNFIYGFNALTTLRIRAVYLSSGSHLVANNSIRIDDAPADNETAGIFVSTGTEHVALNNCVISYENDVPAYAVDIETGGDILCDYNCWWGSGAFFKIAEDGTTSYTTLANWQATGQDAHSQSLHVSYQSSSDLHIQHTDPTLYRAGVNLFEVARDIDNELRSNPPCVGADEYDYFPNLTAPASVTMSSYDGMGMVLRWTAVPGADSYRIWTAGTLDDLQNNPTTLAVTSATEYVLPINSELSSQAHFCVTAE